MTTPKKMEERIKEGVASFRMTHDQNRNPAVFSPSSYEAGFRAALALPEVKGLVDAVAFYSKRENLGKTVWEDDHRRDGKCWLEDFDNYEIAEVYGPTSTGDYGIKANDALEAWKEFVGEK